MVESEIFIQENKSVGEKGDEVEPHHLLTLGPLGGWAVHQQDDEYLSFISSFFINITKHSKLALFIEKYNSLSKKTMNEHITIC